MISVPYLIVTMFVATGLFFGIRYLVRVYNRYRDSKIIKCPDTGTQAIVEVDALHAALTSLVGQPDIRLKNCWRWPINEDCGQECLTQLSNAPAECLVEGRLKRWYGFKTCIFCHKPFTQVQSSVHKPALQSPEGKLVEWHDVPIENIESVTRTHLPVCWDCYIVQSFRTEHPELVVYRGTH